MTELSFAVSFCAF